ncbi:hypothetical protein ALC60_05097 [Trachymyrmex zeteki]|uniref:GAG-pre-integrase domain-containing protein n=1 Tax=Mycetomoellerius zeteki TaxID=64791 RepID=A0A151X6F5_9HYME|nr:hypothetical protein ALC60_05097 [Trachymyrmex zeteki]
MLRKNLFSIGACTARGHSFVFRNDKIEIYSKKDKLIAQGDKQENNLFKLAFAVTARHEANAVSRNVLKFWHDRLGHVNNIYLQTAIENNLIKGVNVPEACDFFCEDYQYDKSPRVQKQKFERNVETR